MLDRRGFLKFAGGAGVGILATPVVWQSTDNSAIWSQNWPWIPDPARGETSYVRTISKLCPVGQGVRIRLLDSRPVTVHGDPEHPLSLGAMSGLAASEVQLLHSPARLRQPHKRGADGKHAPISWDEALKLLSEGLKQATAKGGIYALSGDPTSSINEVLSALTNRSQGSCFLMPSEEQPASTAWSLMGGAGRIGYDFANSDMVLAIGAGVLESWGPVVRNRRAWSAGRPAGQKPSFRLAYAGPLQDHNATAADVWMPLKPGQELVLALGLIHLLLAAGRTAPCEDTAALAELVRPWTPGLVAETTGIAAVKLEALAKELLSARKPLVIVGSLLGQGGGAAPILAGLACNLLLGNVNAEGGMRVLPVPVPVIAGASTRAQLCRNDLMAWVQGLSKETTPPGAVIFYEANPVYALPGAAAPLFEKAGFTVAFTSFKDETAEKCDLILPAAMGLERYDDAETPYGCGEIIYGISQPVSAPLFEARSAGDVLIELARAMGILSSPAITDMVGLLKAKAARLGADWTSLSNGEAFVSRKSLEPGLVKFNVAVLSAAVGAASPAAASMLLAPAVRLALGTPETGIPPYAVKLVTAREVNRHQSIVHMNNATAVGLGVSDGMAVTIKGAGGMCPALVLVDESVMPGTVSLLYGMGHTAFDAYSRNKGSNLLQLAAPLAEAGTGLTMWSTISVTVAKA